MLCAKSHVKKWQIPGRRVPLRFPDVVSRSTGKAEKGLELFETNFSQIGVSKTQGALIWTLNSRALVLRTPRARPPPSYRNNHILLIGISSKPALCQLQTPAKEPYNPLGRTTQFFEAGRSCGLYCEKEAVIPQALKNTTNTYALMAVSGNSQTITSIMLRYIFEVYDATMVIQ